MLKKNIGILSGSLKDLDIVDYLPNENYICYNNYFRDNRRKDINVGIDFLISNDCFTILVISLSILNYINEIKEQYPNISFIVDYKDLKRFDCLEKKTIILYNLTDEYDSKIYKNNQIIDYNKLNTFRKDVSPKRTVNTIKKILKKNKIKVKEKGKRKNLNGVYSLRLELSNKKGSNGKGLSRILAKASAYAELMERLQSKMLDKSKVKESKTNITDRNNKYFDSLLFNTSREYKEKFFDLDNVYFETEKLLNLKTNKSVSVPLSAVNFFCHTNGLASGNSFSEAVTQGIFEILERYCYKYLLDNNQKVKNININKYPINKKNRELLNELEKLGYKYYIKDCSLEKYPVVGLLVLSSDETKYTFTIGADYSFDIALSRCITEMFQGMTVKDLNQKMIKRIPLTILDNKYKNDYLSYNWLKCFNNNAGNLPNGFFCKTETLIKKLNFKNYLINNDEILGCLKESIEQDILIKDYSNLGFDTYRIYIPYMSSVDCYDIVDLNITKHFNKLTTIYKNITTSSNDEIDFFVDQLYEACHSIKYDQMVKPNDMFHVEETSNYYKLDFTSLLILLMIKQNRKIELSNLLTFKLNNFQLAKNKIITYKIFINKLLNKNIYKINNPYIENQVDEIFDNINTYILKLNPQYINKEAPSLFNKKSSLY